MAKKGKKTVEKRIVADTLKNTISVFQPYKNTFSQLLHAPKKMALLLLFDVLFVVAFLFVNEFLATLANIWFAEPSGNWIVRVLAFLFFLFILAVEIGIYAFFKYCVLDVLLSYEKTQEFTFAHLLGFTVHNGILFLVITAISFLLPAVYMPLMPANGEPGLLLSITFASIITILGCLLLWFGLISQILYLKKKKLDLALYSESWGVLSAHVSSLALLALGSLVAYGAYVLLFALLGFPVKQFYFTTSERINAGYGIYTVIFAIGTFAVVYLALLYNRLCILKMVEKK